MKFFWKDTLFIPCLYVGFQVIANILSLKIAILPFVSMSTDAGTLIYPITFTLRDMVHKSLGKGGARNLVWTSAFMCLLMSLMLYIVVGMAPDSAWGLNEEFSLILGPVWRIVAASIMAQLVSELIDTEVFSRLYYKIGDVFSVVVSNAVSLIIDSVLFTIIAFYGDLPSEVLYSIILTNILIKGMVSIITSPAIKLIRKSASVKI